MVAVSPALTWEDLLKTPHGEAYRYELLGGRLIESCSPNVAHALVSRSVFKALDAAVSRAGLGEVFFAPIDVRRAPHDVVVPDVFYLSSERLHIQGDQFVDGAPDLIIEILSPSSRIRDLNAKHALYARAGVREYWVIDIDSSSVQVFSLGSDGTFETLESSGGRVPSRLFESLQLSVAELFPARRTD